MKNERFTKKELGKIARCWKDLEALKASCADETARGLLSESAGRLGEILRWQDFPFWQSLQEGGTGAQA
jgi:hypothetical protein